jgi:competence protein ComEC
MLLAPAAWLPRRDAVRDVEAPARWQPSWVLSAAGLAFGCAALLWANLLGGTAARLTVAVLDVGQGDAILITTPSGHRILVDGGPSPSALLNALGRELPSGSRRIDLVVLTHPQEDHVAGLPAANERYEVRAAAHNGAERVLPSYSAWLEALKKSETPLVRLSAGQVARAGEVAIEVLGPPEQQIEGGADEANNNSVVLRVRYRDVSFLLTGDLAFRGEEALLAGWGDLHATVLKVGHHGSDGASGADFIAAVRPVVAVISTGEDNSFGHPAPSTLLRLSGTPVYRTDRNGTVRFQTDGRRLYVTPDRGSYHLVAAGP